MIDDEEYEQRIEDNVAAHGWHCVVVQNLEEGDPGFAYSVGIPETLGMPELIVFGLDAKVMHGMLWDCFRHMESGGEINDGDRLNWLLQGFDCVVRTVHPANVIREYLNSAMWFHGDPDIHGPVEVMQILWPDPVGGLFPWEPDCNHLIRAFQPLLYLPPQSFQ